MPPPTAKGAPTDTFIKACVVIAGAKSPLIFKAWRAAATD